ncbi:hypothetical protein [Streptomyces inhibens]|uniref:hypothetical protein n=1 Tax=Streptomyces inhibens TaxID=2293571 RepID=UPI001EE6F10D|nr:hypothetical protein [Streptomyces inhibens]UKY54539.1 hypothetical protein KI385_40855 [Streptomyces inhibens]
MTYQQYPTQPGQQPPSPQGMYPPPPPKKMSAGAKVGIGCGSAFGAIIVLVIIGAVVGGNHAKPKAAKPDKVASAPKQDQAKDDAKPAQEKPKTESKAAPKSQAQRFKDFINASGTSKQKAAAKHITSVQGADEKNGILDSAEIHTDYTGGLLGPNGGNGKLLASVFAEWQHSKNGLVTVYDEGGEILSNGNY